MRKKTIKKLCCPFDKGDIELTSITTDIDDNVLEGFFTCGTCQRIYPIIKGIPIMNPDEYREFKLEQPVMEQYRPYLKGRNVDKFRLTDGNFEEEAEKPGTE